MEPPMAERLREVLREELAALGDDAHVAIFPFV